MFIYTTYIIIHLFLCKFQMSGPHVDVEKIKLLSDPKLQGNPAQITLRNRVLDVCTNRGRY